MFTTNGPKKYTCASSKCKASISRWVHSCKTCLKDFHPACCNENTHKIFNSQNKLVPCTGIIERIQQTNVKKVSDKKKSDKQKQKVVDAGMNISPKNASSDVLVDKLEQQVDDRMVKIMTSVDNIDDSNFKDLRTDLKQCIKEEFFSVKEHLVDLIETRLSNIISVIRNEMENMKQSLGMESQCKLNAQSPQNNSYSSAVKSSKSDKNKTNCQRIIVQNIDTQQDGIETVNMIKSKVDLAKLGIGVNKIINADNGRVIIDVEKDEDKVVLINEIQNKIGNNVTATPVIKKLPKLKIINIEQDIFQQDSEKLTDQLKLQNGLDSDSQIKIIKKYNTSEGHGSLILEVNPDVHKAWLINNKINLGWKQYRIYNYVDIVRCHQCWGFNHFKDKCTKKPTCRKCAGNHTEKDCDSTQLKCVNCSDYVERNKIMDCNLAHEATNHNCQVYQRMIETKKKNILYQ